MDTPVIVQYEPDEHPTECPQCHTPDFIDGKGTQWDVRAITRGVPSRVPPGIDGAVSRNRYLVCGQTWDVRWPDGAIFLA